MKNKSFRNDGGSLLNSEKRNSKFRTALISILVLLVMGILLDATSGFYILRNSKSLFFGLGGLILFSLFYLVGEGLSEWIGSKDDVSQPLPKRVFNLFILIVSIGGLTAACWFVFNRLYG